MRRIRAMIVIAGLAAVVWLVPGTIRAVLVWFGPPPAAGPGPLAPLLLFVPETVPVWAWHSVAPWPVVLAGVTALTLAVLAAVGSSMALDRMPAAGPRWRIAIFVWLVVVAAGVLVFGLQAVASLVDDLPFIRLTYVTDRGGAAVAQGLTWGVLWGWIPGVVASRLTPQPAAQPVPRRARAALLGGIALALVASTLVVAARPMATDANYAATGQYTTNGVQPPPPQPAPAPTPPPPLAPSALPPDPSWCTTAQLAFSDGGADAATGHRAAAIRAQNIGDTSCTLASYPDLAFADPDGDAVAVTVAPGGGFMTDDPGPVPFRLEPGAMAVAYAAWDATDGRTTLDTVYIAPYAGAQRVVITVARAWDLTEASEVAVTAWQPA